MYDTASGELLQELRRGTDKAEVYSLAFSPGSALLACTSDKGTVHIFRLNDAAHEAAAGEDGGGGGEGARAAPPAPLHAALDAAAFSAPDGGDGGAAGGGDANPRSSFAFMRAVLPKYFSSEWSFAQFRVPDTRSVVSFGAEPHTIIGACEGGGGGRFQLAWPCGCRPRARGTPGRRRAHSPTPHPALTPRPQSSARTARTSRRTTRRAARRRASRTRRSRRASRTRERCPTVCAARRGALIARSAAIARRPGATGSGWRAVR